MTVLHHDHLIVHCSATPPSADIDAAWIDKLHSDRGWRGCGYNEVITRGGVRQNAERGYPARPLTETAAHVGDCNVGAYKRANWNARSIGICLVGGVAEDGRTPEDNYTDAQWASLSQSMEEYWERAPRIERETNTLGHRDLIKMTGAPAKACPCFSVKSWLDVRLDATEPGVVDRSALERREQSGGRKSFVDGLLGEIGREIAERLGVTIEPSALSPATHTVRPGDTLWSLSTLYGVPLRDLIAANGIEKPDCLVVGTKLRIFP